MPSREFINDRELVGGPLRPIGDIRHYAKLFKIALQSHTKKKKLSSAEFFNCEEQPLDKTLPDKCLLLKVLPPMPLHIKLGIVNMLFDALDDFLELIGAPIRSINWAMECGLIAAAYYGGKVQFNGNGCNTLLNSLDKLHKLLLDNNLHTVCKPYLDVFEAFKCVVRSCFGNILYENRYKNDIRQFAVAFFKLIEFCNAENQSRNPSKKLKFTVRPKVHAVFIHIIQFFEMQKSRGFANFGLGFYRGAFIIHVAIFLGDFVPPPHNIDTFSPIMQPILGNF